ncbi:MAG: hypothetical protein Q8929_00230 [Bacillota bacterium]|nr:hypothetical protein [Bacillota bacterium]
MSKRTINSQNTSMLISSLLNLDVSALQTTDIAQCREPIWELQQTQKTQKTQSKMNPFVFNHVNQWKERQSSLRHCIERLFNCLSEEAQRAISQGIDKYTRLEIE